MKKISESDYGRRVKTEAEHFSEEVKKSQINSEKVQRFSPKVPAFDEAMRLYQPIFYEKMPHMALDKYIIDFCQQSSDQIRIVSLGCGTGDWEIELVEKAPKKIEMDLVEINEELLKYTKDYGIKNNLKIKTIIQDVNKLELTSEYYDFVVVRSSLHHFLELEHVFEEIGKSLKPKGKFLVMGEVIGRNGQLLYDETREVVNKIMSILPEKYRVNHNTKTILSKAMEKLPEKFRLKHDSNVIDKTFPNIDYAKDSFEAIRSEEIYPLIMKYFNPVEHIVFDAIISYLLDFRYGPNYDLNNKLDRTILELIVQLDMYYLENKILKPTSLFGIFEKIN